MRRRLLHLPVPVVGVVAAQGEAVSFFVVQLGMVAVSS